MIEIANSGKRQGNTPIKGGTSLAAGLGLAHPSGLPFTGWIAEVLDESPPGAVLVVVYDRQRYTLDRFEDRLKRDGSALSTAVWRTRCADCGKATEIHTAAAAEVFSPNRRCPEHAQPGLRVKQVRHG